MEIQALEAVFRGQVEAVGQCALTSPKSTFGHTFAAAGLLSVISLVQAMRAELIPASLHCEQLSDYVEWEKSPFYVNRQSRIWPRRAQPRTGAVSAFGMSGTNAHVVLESYDAAPALDSQPAEAAPYYLLALSAKTPQALAERIADLAAFLQGGSTPSLSAVSYTLLCTRQHFAHRVAFIVSSVDQAIALLQSWRHAQRTPIVLEGKVPETFIAQPLLLNYAETLLTQSGTGIEAPLSYQQTLQGLADLYCQGYELRWEKLYGARVPARIALPTYPFAGNQVWPASNLTATARKEPASGNHATLPDQESFTTVLVPRWERVPSSAPSAMEISERWLMVEEELEGLLGLAADEAKIEVLARCTRGPGATDCVDR